MSIGPNGAMYVMDYKSRDVKVLDLAGDVVASIAVDGYGAVVAMPTGRLIVGRSGRVWCMRVGLA